MDRGAWWSAVYEVKKESDTTEQLNITTTCIHTHTYLGKKQVWGNVISSWEYMRVHCSIVLFFWV